MRTPPEGATITTASRSGIASLVYASLFFGGIVVSWGTIRALVRHPDAKLPTIPFFDVDLAFLPVVVAIAGVFAALVGLFGFFVMSMRAPCPSCGAIVEPPASNDIPPFHCAACDRFLEGSDRKVWVVEESRIEPAPAFAAPFPNDAELGAECLVCGAPSTRAIEVHWTSTLEDASRRPRSVDMSQSFPHCAAHDDGVSVLDPAGAPRTLSFRSLPRLRAYCRANRIVMRRT